MEGNKLTARMEISAPEISPRWNGIKRFHWADWAGRDAKDAKGKFFLKALDFFLSAFMSALLSSGSTERKIRLPLCNLRW